MIDFSKFEQYVLDNHISPDGMGPAFGAWVKQTIGWAGDQDKATK
jgi:predicted ATP-grasp superfamily ATP-dependent carboligase